MGVVATRGCSQWLIAADPQNAIAGSSSVAAVTVKFKETIQETHHTYKS